MSDTIEINRLPTRTWNKLNVNSAKIEWNNDKSAVDTESVIAGSEEISKFIRFMPTGSEAYSSKQLNITAEEKSNLTVFEICSATKPFATHINISVAKGASVRLIQLLNPTNGAVLRHETVAECGKGGKFELITIMLGDGDVYADNLIELEGDGSILATDVAYLGCRSHTIDYNIIANHYGKSTQSTIKASGALMDSAKKVFRGSIDFKKGSAGSVGSENETVLMLGNNVINKTVPLILCAEENVDGGHGATIGELDESTLFYFQSRGIDKNQAENIMAKAAVERLIRAADDSEFSEHAVSALNTLIDSRQDGE